MSNSASKLDQAINAADIDIQPIAGRIGALISGVKLGADMDASLVAAIRAAVLKYKVVFFRDQQHFDDATHEAFSAHLGPLLKHPNAKAADGSESILELSTSEAYSASRWHTDLTFIPQVAAFSILRPCVLPEIGGDTLWANTVEAYNNMPEALKPLLDTLWGIHSTAFDFQGEFSEAYKNKLGEYKDKAQAHSIETEHPVVHVHPETGERALLLGVWLKRFVGLNNAQSQKLFEIFQEIIECAENTVRWNWQTGDVAIWDNTATQHRSVPDFGDQTRILRRVTVAGKNIPVSVDGKHSRMVER